MKPKGTVLHLQAAECNIRIKSIFTFVLKFFHQNFTAHSTQHMILGEGGLIIRDRKDKLTDKERISDRLTREVVQSLAAHVLYNFFKTF